METWYYTTEYGGVEYVVAGNELSAVREIKRRLSAMRYDGRVLVYSMARMMRGPIRRLA